MTRGLIIAAVAVLAIGLAAPFTSEAQQTTSPQAKGKAKSKSSSTSATTTSNSSASGRSWTSTIFDPVHARGS
jgi:Flp pilus assembly protein TadD